jgi:hypothetical protein
MNRMYERIDGTRRRFLSMSAFGLAAAKLGLVRSASAQSNAPGLPAARPEAAFPGFSAEMVRATGTTIHVLVSSVTDGTSHLCTQNFHSKWSRAPIESKRGRVV